MNTTMKLVSAALTLAATLMISTTAWAQNPNTRTPRIDRREQRQERQIQQDRNRGFINNRQTARFERQEARIKAEERAAKSDGFMSRAERHHLNHELNRESYRIHRF